MPKISVGGPQGLRGGALRDGRARPSSLTAASLCRSASIAVMGPQAADQRRLLQPAAGDRRGVRSGPAGSRAPAGRSTSADIDILHLASELVIDAVIEPELLRAELDPALRARPSTKRRDWPGEDNPVTPVWGLTRIWSTPLGIMSRLLRLGPRATVEKMQSRLVTDEHASGPRAPNWICHRDNPSPDLTARIAMVLVLRSRTK